MERVCNLPHSFNLATSPSLFPQKVKNYILGLSGLSRAEPGLGCFLSGLHMHRGASLLNKQTSVGCEQEAALFFLITVGSLYPWILHQRILRAQLWDLSILGIWYPWCLLDQSPSETTGRCLHFLLDFFSVVLVSWPLDERAVWFHCSSGSVNSKTRLMATFKFMLSSLESSFSSC